MMQTQKLKVSYRKDSFDNDQTVNSFRNSVNDFIINLDNAHLSRRLARCNNQKKPELQKILLKHKVKRLTENFMKKLKLNSIYRQPIEDLEDHKTIQENYSNKFIAKLEHIRNDICQKQGIELANFVEVVWSLINIIQTTVMVFIFSVMLAFRETQTDSLFTYMRVVSFGIYLLDMILNFTTQRNQNGKKLQYIGEISHHYIRNGFLVDIVSILVFPVDIVIQKNITLFLSFIYLMKLFTSIHKFERFQYLVLTSTQREQYFGLIKVFMTNFVIGHFLSILLNLMAELDPQENWRLKMHVESSVWYIKYIWGYYWGTNIMLTVGFGDITATNYKEATTLVFIETVSCITLAYNISYVGALIASIRENEQKKKRKLKTFHRMCKQNQVSNEIQCKISNYIEEAYEIKQNFQYEAHDQVMDFLPKNLQKQYRIQANKILFDSLGFLNNLSKKTLLKLAEEVKRKICHPEEIILRKGEIPDFVILQKGCLALTCKIRSNLDGKAIEYLQVQDKSSKPKMFSLDFIKNKCINFNVKSVDYSVIYYLNREDFMQILRNSEMDFQFLCVLRDRQQNILDQNNLYPCQICKNKYHNKFQCSRLHYMPLKQNIINKYLYGCEKKFRPDKKMFFKFESKKMNCYKDRQLIEDDGNRYIKDNLDEEQFIQAQRLRELYQSFVESQLSQAKTIKTQIVNTLRQILGLEKPRRFNTSYIKSIVEEKAFYKLEELLQANNKEQYKFWEVELDAIQDYRYYFKENNPQNLSKMRKNNLKKARFYL